MQASSQPINTQNANSSSLLVGVVAVAILASVWGWVLGFGKSSEVADASSKTVVTATPQSTPAISHSNIASATPTSVVTSTTTPSTVSPTPPLPSLQLKMAASITSVRFPTGGVLLDPVAAAQVASFAAEPLTKSAAKIHLTGYSGNSKFTLRERRQLAFERAFSVKVALTNNHGYDPQKIRMFYLSNDHFGQPRVDFQTFQTIAEASASLLK